jgi:hypothetical protein
VPEREGLREGGGGLLASERTVCRDDEALAQRREAPPSSVVNEGEHAQRPVLSAVLVGLNLNLINGPRVAADLERLRRVEEGSA